MSQRPAPPANGPQRPGSHPDPAPAPGEDEAARGRAKLRWFLLAFVAAVLAADLPLPYMVAALVFGAAAVVFGILALIYAVRHRLGAFLRVASAVGVGLAAFLTLAVAVAVTLWPVTENLEDCSSRALTIKAEQDCQDRFLNLDGLLSN